jgi:formate dehydrogenase subunit gamma
MTLETFSAKRAGEIIAGHPAKQASLLPILHDVQETFGHVPQAVVPQIAKALNISRADAHGVVSFYHDYRARPAGRHVIKLCRAEACQSMGVEALAEQLSSALGIHFGETAADGSVTLEVVYCLGLCACAPAAMVDSELIGRLDGEAIDEIVESVGVNPSPGWERGRGEGA